MEESGDSSKSPFEININHPYLLLRRTKIVASIGPASSSRACLRKLIRAGVNVARINFSHGEPAKHLLLMRRIRQVARELGESVAILGDLCGPKIRVGTFPGGSIQLREKTGVVITTRNMIGAPGLIPSQYAGLAREVKIGDPILLDDGAMELKVTRKCGDNVEATVIRGGELRDHKGMNLPGTRLHVSALTAKDRRDALYCIRGEADYIALSFVRTPRDIQALRTHLKKHGSHIPIIAKIEKPEALTNINGIMEEADGIMVARGDLGVELPTKKVPQIQTRLIQIANHYDKPVIVATQMLESMIEHPQPTRAEVTDVAAACIAGTDAVMLSAETAAGRYPVEAVAAMDAILREAEAFQFHTYRGLFRAPIPGRHCDVLDAMGVAVAQLSRDLMISAVFVLTRTGKTARIISSDRPAAPMLALTKTDDCARRMALLWGVYPFHISRDLDMKQFLRVGESIARRTGLAKNGDYLLMLSGLGTSNASTNNIMVHRIEKKGKPKRP